MKPYFARYLPVEGEIKDKALVLDKDRNKIGHITYPDNADGIYEVEYLDGTSGGCDHFELVKLFLCSRDIQVGDRIWNQHSGYGKVMEIDEENQYLGVKYDIEDWECEEDFKYIIEVIGEISPEAIWVKEGDEFDESQINKQFYNDSGVSSPWQDEIELGYIAWEDIDLKYKRIQIQCPTCKKFH